jgi:hypothetical protein
MPEDNTPPRGGHLSTATPSFQHTTLQLTLPCPIWSVRHAPMQSDSNCGECCPTYRGVHQKFVASVVFFRYEPRPQCNRRLTGAIAGSLTAIGTRATVAPARSPLIVSTLLGHPVSAIPAYLPRNPIVLSNRASNNFCCKGSLSCSTLSAF